MVWDRTNRPLWLRCTVGILVAIIGAAIRLQFLEILEFRVTFLSFYPAVAVAALYGGLEAGLLATVVSAALANYFWMEPVGQFGITNSADLISMAVFLASGALISYLAEATYRAQERAHKAEEQSRLAAERKQAEVLLQRQAELLHLSYDAIVVWQLEGCIESWNKGAEELYGCSEEEAVGQVTHDLLKTIHPEPWPQIEAKLRERKFWEGELKHHTREGQEVIISARHQLVRGADGVERVLETNRDITERKQAEEALRESEERFRVMANSIPQLAWIAKADRYIYSYNQRWYEYTGTTPKQMEGWGWQSVHDPDALPGVLERWKESIASGEPFDMVFPLRGADGNFRQFLTRIEPVKNADGDLIQWCGTNTDITERKQMEDELRKARNGLELRVAERTSELKAYMTKLEQSNQTLQDFASIASHDMKEPLRKVISFGNMLRQKSGESLGQSGNDYLNRMLNATERMQSLLTGLLDYSRVATASEPFEQVHLSDLIGEVLSDLEVRIVKTGDEVHVETLPVISADPTQMRQLFQNLIGNALKFHKPGEKPMVQVRSVSKTDSGCQIIVEDNGIGFEERYLERIFAPFQRLHGRSEYEGTGMGLAICKKIVERHRGNITARSTPGVGASFIIQLPLKQYPTV
ncbi:MAG: PAS domain S-box protein [Syntrophobacteraceae bacterium]